MLLSLVDSLRCPAHDEEAPLVLAVEAWAGPRIGEGTLGCPVCHARFLIHHRSVEFAPGASSVRHGGTGGDPMRLAAQLSLTEPGGIILLTGRYAAASEQLARFGETIFVLIDAEASMLPLAVNVQVGGRLPFIDGSVRAAAVDETRCTSVFLADVVRCLRDGGRLVMPTDAPLPEQIRAIAQDESETVGEARKASEPVRLRRAPPASGL